MKPVQSSKNVVVVVLTKVRRDGRVLDSSEMKLWEACILSSLYLKNGYSGYRPDQIEVTFQPV